jgi:hypothetical protein
MRILKTMIAVGNEILKCDTIVYKEKLWLAPFWFENIVEKYKFPARIIRMDTLEYDKIPQGYGDVDFYIKNPIPKDVLDHLCPIRKDSGFEVIDHPDIRISTQPEDQYS